VVFSLCLIGQFALVANTPSTKSTPAKIASYYVSHKGRVGGAGLLTALAVVFGVGFFLYLRMYLRRRSGIEWLPALFFTGVVIFAVSGVVGAGMNLSLADNPNRMSPAGLQVMNTLSSNVGWVASSVGLALMYAALAIAISRTAVAPRWLGWVSWLLAVLAATFFLSFISLIATAIWVLVVSIRMAVLNPVVE
jgi:hypothetical protein